ncbi:MAG: toll/interleukin-1 receptor domain-containing protein [Candidatus Acidiferrales bacterium]
MRIVMQIFLSYAQADEAFAKALSSQLERRGFSVWSPAEEMLPGDNVWLRTGEALKRSKAMVVLLSPDSMRSEHVRREIEYALGDPNYEGRLFPVRIRETPDVPWILRRFKTFDFGRSAARVSNSIADALKQVA